VRPERAWTLPGVGPPEAWAQASRELGAARLEAGEQVTGKPESGELASARRVTGEQESVPQATGEQKVGQQGTERQATQRREPWWPEAESPGAGPLGAESLKDESLGAGTLEVVPPGPGGQGMEAPGVVWPGPERSHAR